jgi:hypothetical protein
LSAKVKSPMAMTLSQAAYQHNVCFWHKADIPTGSTDVRFRG